MNKQETEAFHVKYNIIYLTIATIMYFSAFVLITLHMNIALIIAMLVLANDASRCAVMHRQMLFQVKR